ncbi:ent-kaurene synthase TSP4, chloroplastic isoform X2 [Daucus carota subsp. sativus]|uniref:ent-kaurene synthase TSP4, chloroplastic isoform X2 n=1 Tax=Daucus carota subsp. sativus TaxID=79200 RepID=UPI0030829C03
MTSFQQTKYSSQLSSMSLFNLKTCGIPHKLHPHSNYPSLSASLESGKKISPEAHTDVLDIQGRKERIRSLFSKVELSVSAYDTAWVAMVPSPRHSQTPCFSNCVDWILENQLNDGSWGLPHHNGQWLKDDLSSTLACILALKRWGVGKEHINRGTHFLELNFGSAIDDSQPAPVGFDIIFPGMLEYATTLDLKLPLDQTTFNDMLKKRDREIKRYSENQSSQSEAYLAYVSEGMGNSQNWDMIMKFQRKNGSLFNSPSTTAASLSHTQNTGCLNYLRGVLKKFGDAVYPFDIYARLCMVDNLDKLGIDWHFRQEIRTVLDETYSSWLQDDEEIFKDVATCALAFRILRVNGYDVDSEKLTQVAQEDYYCNSHGGHLNDTYEALELYRASQNIIYPNETALEKQNSWSKNFLQRKLNNRSVHSDKYTSAMFQEVEYALKFPYYATLERVVHRRSIEQYNTGNLRILKTLCLSENISNTEFPRFAMEDFNTSQSIYQEELKLLESWTVDNKLKTLEFAREKNVYCYFCAAAMIFPPELHEARITWAKYSILTAKVDDFFDNGGSMEELLNLIQLFKKWNVDVHTECCSENVRILFLALRSTICETVDWASKWQGRNVTNHMIEIWMEVLDTMLKEAEWARGTYVPKMDEYIENGYVSFALGPIVLPTIYLVGPQLSESVVGSDELRNLFKLMSMCGRLLNDIQSYKRESKQGKLNYVPLHMINTDSSSEEDAVGEIKRIIDDQRRELQRLVVEEKESVVPRVCKDLFWKMSRVVHLFYMNDDGFTLENMFGAVKDVLHKPISSDLK